MGEPEIYWFKKEDIYFLVEFSAKAEYRLWLSRIQTFFMVGICSFFNLVVMWLTGALIIGISFFLALGISFVFIGIGLFLRTYHRYEYFLKQEEQKFNEITYRARLNHEIRAMTEGQNIS